MLTSSHAHTLFGDPRSETSMTLWHVPPEVRIATIPKRIYCNKLLITPLTTAFANIIACGLEEEVLTYDGCFNIRVSKSASGKPANASLHSWGLAIDINAAWNRFGATPTLSKELVSCFSKAGFDWGGTWAYPDGMHFQLASRLTEPSRLAEPRAYTHSPPIS